MAMLIQSSPVLIDNDINLMAKGVILTNGSDVGTIPSLYSSEGRYVSIVNSWFLHLIVENKLKNINSYHRALLAYWRFLEEEKIKWDYLTPIKSNKPTYKFRSEVLLKKVNSGDLERSTANTYMRHVISFYMWAISRRYLVISDELLAPFKLEKVAIDRDDLFAHIKPKFYVETTDLRVRVYKDSQTGKVRGLKPLQENHIETVGHYLKYECIEFKLLLGLIFQCGLRPQEACSFTGVALDNAVLDPDTGFYLVVIGLRYGVRTKNDKQRTIEMPPKLYQALSDYLVSNRRLTRVLAVEEKLKALKAEANVIEKTLKSIVREELQLMTNLDSDTNKLYEVRELKKATQVALATTQSSVDSFEQILKFEFMFVSQRGNIFSTNTLNTRWSNLRKKIKQVDQSFDHKLYDGRSTYGTYTLKSLIDSGLSQSDAIEDVMSLMGHENEYTVWIYVKFLNRKQLHIKKFGILDKIMDWAIDS